MVSKSFTFGRIRQADYDAQTRQLDLQWDNRTVTAYAQVPEEVFRRLCNAPTPATYWEDRIAEEYPKAVPQRKTEPASPSAAQKFQDLFGGNERES